MKGRTGETLFDVSRAAELTGWHANSIINLARSGYFDPVAHIGRKAHQVARIKPRNYSKGYKRLFTLKQIVEMGSVLALREIGFELKPAVQMIRRKKDDQGQR